MESVGMQQVLVLADNVIIITYGACFPVVAWASVEHVQIFILEGMLTLNKCSKIKISVLLRHNEVCKYGLGMLLEAVVLKIQGNFNSKFAGDDGKRFQELGLGSDWFNSSGN